jgi:glycosyltransferase involved in cell wall biosynthesis
LQLGIVIPTRNRVTKLERTLQSLLAQTTPLQDFEVVVVDNGSSDNTPELLRQYGGRFANWKCLKQTKPGAAAARNCGIESCKSQILLFLDDDVIAEPDLVQQHLNGHLRHPGAAVLGYVRNGWSENDSAFRWILSHKELIHSFQFPDPLSVPFQHLYTCNASVPREALLKAGLFDERFVGAAFEDTDLGYRLKRSGCPLVFNAHATVTHNPVLSLKTFTQKRSDAGRALHQLLGKHPELEGTLLPSKWRRIVRSTLGSMASPLAFTFERRVSFAPIMLPLLGKACWYHFEYLFWTGYYRAARLENRTTETAVCRPAS